MITAASPRRLITSVVLFAGAGGSCTGIAAATGQSPMLAINHNPIALASHAANHPTTRHLCEDVFQAQPWRVWPRRMPLDLLWASPDCTHFSRAKGSAPVSAGRRSLADVVIDWAAQARPAVILLENVPEFLGWGPIYSCGHPLCCKGPNCDKKVCGQPIKARAGEFFHAWVLRLQLLGYRVEWRVLRACDYGVPTIRRRLYLVARCDGRPIVWPEPTHGPGLLPYVPAAECIDWSDLGRSIFKRPKPLAENTLRRVFVGLRKFVLEAPEPFILRQTSEGMWTPWLAQNYGTNPPCLGIDLRRPLGTVTTCDHHMLVVPHLLNLSHGGRHEALVAAYLVQYYGSGGQGSSCAGPLPAVVTRARHGLVTVTLAGEEWAVCDITLRMLKPRELARAQGFPDSYDLLGTTTEQIAQIGNAVCPPVAEALVRANMECVA